MNINQNTQIKNPSPKNTFKAAISSNYLIDLELTYKLQSYYSFFLNKITNSIYEYTNDNMIIPINPKDDDLHNLNTKSFILGTTVVLVYSIIEKDITNNNNEYKNKDQTEVLYTNSNKKDFLLNGKYFISQDIKYKKFQYSNMDSNNNYNNNKENNVNKYNNKHSNSSIKETKNSTKADSKETKEGNKHSYFNSSCNDINKIKNNDNEDNLNNERNDEFSNKINNNEDYYYNNGNKCNANITFKNEKPNDCNSVKNNNTNSSKNKSNNNLTIKLIVIYYNTTKSQLSKHSFFPHKINNYSYDDRNKNKILIGRKSTDIIITDDKYISKEHGFFEYDNKNLNTINNNKNTNNNTDYKNKAENNNEIVSLEKSNNNCSDVAYGNWVFKLSDKNNKIINSENNHYDDNTKSNIRVAHRLTYWIEVINSKHIYPGLKFINNGYLYIFNKKKFNSEDNK